MGRRRGSQGRNFIRNARQKTASVYDVGQGDISGPGVVLLLTLIGVVIAFSPSYLGLAPASILSDALMALASSLWIWSTVGLLVEFGKLKELFSGPDQEGWEYLLIAVVFLAPTAALQGGVAVLELPLWIEVACKLLSLILAVPGAMFVAGTLDSFFIKPRLRNLGKPSKPGRSKAEQRSLLGSTATAIAWVLSNTSAMLLILERLAQ